jgi:hypothetical protein
MHGELDKWIPDEAYLTKMDVPPLNPVHADCGSSAASE